MNNNFREGLNALREISNPELIKLALEKITGKKLADYEGVNALVGALMGYYNDEVKKKLTQGTVPNSLNSAEKIVAALQGNGGLKFDENLLYIEDKGIKKKGFYYLSRLMSGIFECLEQTEETVNNSAKFKDISNKSNSDRLDNLYNYKMLFKDKQFQLNDAESILHHIDTNYNTAIIYVRYSLVEAAQEFARIVVNRNMGNHGLPLIHGNRLVGYLKCRFTMSGDLYLGSWTSGIDVNVTLFVY